MADEVVSGGTERRIYDGGGSAQSRKRGRVNVNFASLHGLMKDIHRQASVLHPEFVWGVENSEDGTCIHMWPVLPDYAPPEIWVFHTGDIQVASTRRRQIAEACRVSIDAYREHQGVTAGTNLILPPDWRGDATVVR